MFEKTLSEKFKKIFSLSKVTYAQPAHDDPEQETLFIEIDNCNSRVLDAKVTAIVRGKASVYVQSDKMPFGYFAKAINDFPNDTKDLFFYEIEENSRRYQNLVQRGFSFVYLFSGQYDPDIGTLNSIQFEEPQT